MNPLLEEFLKSILRKALTGAAVYLVTTGWITAEQSERFIAGAILGLLSLVISGWKVYKDRLFDLAAQAMPAGATTRDVQAVVRAGEAPPSTLSKDAVPHLQPPQ